MLGICFGHQLLAQALGGEVAANPAGREIGTVMIDQCPSAVDDPLFAVLGARFQAQATHSEAVVRLPPESVLLASSSLCAHHAFRVGCAWGVQFHPEINATIMREYIRERADAIRSEGLDPDRLLSDVRDCDAGDALLRRFREIVEGAQPRRDVGFGLLPSPLLPSANG